MNIALILQIAELALGIIKSQTTDAVDDKIDELTALARIVAAGTTAYEQEAGQPLDEALIKEQERIL